MVHNRQRVELTPAQQALAWKFQRTSPSMKSMNDAAKCIDDCFKLMKGELTEEEFRARTGHEPHGIRSKKK